MNHKFMEYETKFESLGNIINNSDILLLDTSIVVNASHFLSNLFNTKNYHGIDKKNLDCGLDSINFGCFLVEQEKSKTIKKVIEENKRLCEILSDKLKYLNSHSNLDNEEDLENKKILEDLTFSINKVNKRLNRKVITGDNNYNTIYNCICTLEDNLRIKQDNSDTTLKSYRKYEDIRTDEELVSMAFYLSTLKQKKVSILSSDVDLYRLTKFFSAYINNTKDLGDLKEAIIKFPVTSVTILNTVINEEYEKTMGKVFSSSDCKDLKMFSKYKRLLESKIIK